MNLKSETEAQVTAVQEHISEHDPETMAMSENWWKEEFFKAVKKDKSQVQKYMTMEDDLLHPLRKTGVWAKIWIGFLLAVCLAGVYAYYLQESRNKYETINLRDYTMWGVYISTFVFYIALSIVGALMSAVLKLIKFEWYRPLARMAEIIAFAAIVMAGLCIMVAMGRPDRLHYLVIYGRIQSPITWDVIIVVTYIVASALLFFMSAVPCMKICSDRLEGIPRFQKWLYKTLSFGWKETPEQVKILKKGVLFLAIIIIPTAIAIQTVDAWLFATTLRAEWDSTNFGTYFISGALVLAAAAMIVAIYVCRKAYRFEKYLTEKHFDYMGKMLVFLSWCYMYTNINEYLIPSYKMSGLHANHLLNLFTQDSAPMYWLVAVFGIFVPALFPIMPSMRKPLPLLVIALLTVAAAWFKRYLIVIPGLLHPYLPIQDVPESWTHYTPSMIEMTIVGATFAGLLLIITLLSKFVPIISIWEVSEGEGFNIQRIHKMREPVKQERKASAVLVNTFLVVALILPGMLHAQEYTVSLTLGKEDTVKVCQALVTADGLPAEEQGVKFYVKRFFGLLPLGPAVYTDENGIAKTNFLLNLPGDSAGNLNVVASLEDDEEVLDEATAPWGFINKPQIVNDQKALWASRTNVPTYFIIVSNLIIVAIWIGMFYVMYLLFYKIRQSGIDIHA
ncbi:MAG: NrfD/PsrC family molybdoenzyme membrane anchor subunit [Bacteroidia bacterium]|jgi:molybdopterin-containing oxidoreductase family membrane subunit